MMQLKEIQHLTYIVKVMRRTYYLLGEVKVEYLANSNSVCEKAEAEISRRGRCKQKLC